MGNRAVQVHTVTTRRERDQFVRFPWQIYADDPNWVPPLLLEELKFLDPKKHPFHKHGSAMLFLASRNDRLVGRIMASDDPNYNQEHSTNVGCFGMFECIEDQAVADALFNAASEWVRARGRTSMMGPVDYSTNYRCGLLIDGFDTPPRVMMNHNRPYFKQLLESWGLTKAKDLYSYWIDLFNEKIDCWARRVQRLADRSNVTIRYVSDHDSYSEMERFKMVYNAAWEKNWGFVKMTDAEFSHFRDFLSHIRVSDYLLLAEADGQPVGMCMTLPDFNEAIRPLNGRITKFGLPIGVFQIRRNLKRVKAGRLLTLGVLEGYRRRGIIERMILAVLKHGREMGYTGGELGWTLEDNESINRTIEVVGASRYKTYRIYEKTLD